MDNLIASFTDKLETHPTISKLWIDYLQETKIKTETLLIQGKKTLLLLEEVKDVEMQDMLLLMLFLQTNLLEKG